MRHGPIATPYAVSLVPPEVLSRVGFTDHAIERFSARAGLATTSRRVVEPLIRDLLLQEGLVVAERPHWARSRNTADLYLQLGEWMLFIGCRQPSRLAHYTIVTVVNGPDGTTWRQAVRRGYVFTPPPPLILDETGGHHSFLVSIVAALWDRRASRSRETVLGAIRLTHRARTERTEVEPEREIASLLVADDPQWTRSRQRARQRHLARYRFK